MSRRSLSRVLIGWLPAILLVVTSVAVLRLTCPGCVDQARANTDCELIADRPSKIDVSISAQWRHLVSDAQLAEELAVQYADAKFYRWAYPIRTATSGPVQTSETHADNVRAQVDCLARLNTVIEDLHGVTSLQRTLANQQRSVLFDSLVVLSFLPMYVLGVRTVCERLGGLLRADAPVVRVSAVAISSIISSGVGLVAFRVWWAMMEGMRVANPDGHFGFRAAAHNYWSSIFVASWLAVGVLLFWFVAFAFRRVDDSPSAGERDGLTSKWSRRP
jgi:phage shock protein PspC (stress-responsive transcriptional regulator)